MTDIADQDEQLKKALGAFKIWTADDNGNFVSTVPKSADQKPAPDPAADAAVDIYMSPTGQPTDDQSKLYDDVNSVLDVVKRLYLPAGTRPNKAKFRAYYVRIFRLSQVGLEGKDPSPKQSKGALESLKASLLDDEGLNIKTKNLSALGETALMLSLPLAIVYFVLLVAGTGDIDKLLKALQISRTAMANMMLLWIGCFTGVCMSYGIRTNTFTMADLVTPGPDRLSPGMRLLFIGTLTMFFGLLFMKKIVEIKIGSYSSADIEIDPSLAFIVGTLFGLGEAVLPGLAGKRADNFFKGLQ
ncbi:MAG: hypothetical protein AB3X44_17060 [Leptothrix sp. (in: b-proteobacteria)]